MGGRRWRGGLRGLWGDCEGGGGLLEGWVWIWVIANWEDAWIGWVG